VEEEEPPGAAPDAAVNTDLRPVAVHRTALVLERSEGGGGLGIALAGFWPLVLLAAALLAAALVRRGRSLGLAGQLSALTSGAAAMGLWVVLLMAYQAKVGALYGDLALLAAAFMAGLALGARLHARLWVVDAAFLAAGVGTAAVLPAAPGWLHAFLAALAGAAGGATLGNAAARDPARASRLYALDLAGAALAALFFGGWLVPAWGAAAASVLAATLKLLALVGQLASRDGNTLPGSLFSRDSAAPS
jgi:hypothetical protein